MLPARLQRGSLSPEALEAHSQAGSKAGRADQDKPPLWPARAPLPFSVLPRCSRL